jgi:dihydroxyacetone kinase-like protein
MGITSIEMKGIFAAWAEKMTVNMTKLVELDSVAGDGDLGLAMFDGFTAIKAATKDSDEVDIGKLLYLAGKTLSTAAPSTTGTLLAAGMINGAKAVRGTTDMGVEEFARYMGARRKESALSAGQREEKKQSLTVWLRRWIS